MKLVVFLLIIAQIHFSVSSIEEFSDQEVDKNNFIDIHSMTSEDSEDDTQDQIPDSKEKSAPRTDSETAKEVQVLENPIEQENINNGAIDSSINTEIAPKAESCDKGVIFFQQFTRRILNFLDKDLPENLKDNQLLYYKAIMELTPTQISIIREFAKADTEAGHYLNEAHHIISESFSYLSLQTETPLEVKWKFEDTFGFSAYELLMVSLSLLGFFCTMYIYRKMRMSLILFLRRLFIISFIWSIPWNWMYLFKKEVAARAAVASKCRSIEVKGMGYGEMIINFFLPRTDPIKECYQGMLMEPWTTIPPTKVFAFTMANFLLEPLEHFGLALKKFLLSFFTDLPVTLWPLSIIMLFAIFFLPMFFYMNYELRLPAFLGAIGPSQRAHNLCIECKNSATVLRNSSQSENASITSTESHLTGEVFLENAPTNNLKDASTQYEVSKISVICTGTQTEIQMKTLEISDIATEKDDKYCQTDNRPIVKKFNSYKSENET